MELREVTKIIYECIAEKPSSKKEQSIFSNSKMIKKEDFAFVHAINNVWEKQFPSKFEYREENYNKLASYIESWRKLQ